VQTDPTQATDRGNSEFLESLPTNFYRMAFASSRNLYDLLRVKPGRGIATRAVGVDRPASSGRVLAQLFMPEHPLSSGIEHEGDTGQQDEFGKQRMAAARRGRPGAYRPPYDRLSDVARAGLAEAFRMSLPPILEGIVEL
jgi:hypothetical protein